MALHRKLSLAAILGFGALLATLTLSALPACAQSTWNGLHFGMSEEEADQTLRTKGMTTSERNPNVLAVQPTYQVSLPDLVNPLPFYAELTFSKGALQQIDLNLITDEALKSIGSLYAVVDTVNGSMKKALTAKYGQPIEANGACDAGGNDLVGILFNGNATCSESWQSQGQLISVKWWYDKQRSSFAYIASYQPSSPDL